MEQGELKKEAASFAPDAAWRRAACGGGAQPYVGVAPNSSSLVGRTPPFWYSQTARPRATSSACEPPIRNRTGRCSFQKSNSRRCCNCGLLRLLWMVMSLLTEGDFVE